MREFRRDENRNAVSDLVALGNNVGTLIAVVSRYSQLNSVSFIAEN